MGYEILIIDDDPDQHLILDKYLRLAGYEVLHTENAEDGLSMLEKRIPDLVLLDVQMPGMDGFQTLETIRKKAAFRNVSVLFLTALDRRHLKIKGLELGADDYITKPFDRAELLARINAVLRRSDRHRRLEGIMEGDLSDVGISELLQSMELSSKTATIFLKDMDGEIIVKTGELVSARQGSHVDEPALWRLFLLEKGSFFIKFNEIPDHLENVATKPLMGVLMNIANEVDEIRDLIAQLKIGDQLIKIVGDVSEFPALIPVKPKTPMTITEMITEMTGHPKESIKQLIAASKKGLLKKEK